MSIKNSLYVYIQFPLLPFFFLHPEVPEGYYLAATFCSASEF